MPKGGYWWPVEPRLEMEITSPPKFLIVSLIVPVLAEETFYIIFDKTLKGCTIAGP
jgi:hypothetical protein